MSYSSACGASVTLKSVAKAFDETTVLDGVDLTVSPGEFVTVVGRSGSGKSTLLRLLCGLDEPTAGSVRVTAPDGGDASSTVRVVFQESRLLPWKTVLGNVCLGGRADVTERALDALSSVGLADRVQDYPGVLSGGQQQRVALARALVHEPCVLLLDEPFGALDALTRIEAQRLVERLWLERGFTAILVTHDVGEAVLLGDRVLFVEHGRIAESFGVQVPRPRRREHPDVARVMGAVLDRIFEPTDVVRPSASGLRDEGRVDSRVIRRAVAGSTG